MQVTGPSVLFFCQIQFVVPHPTLTSTIGSNSPAFPHTRDFRVAAGFETTMPRPKVPPGQCARLRWNCWMSTDMAVRRAAAAYCSGMRELQEEKAEGESAPLPLAMQLRQAIAQIV